MDEEKKAEILAKQIEEHRNGFDRRRAYEWKLSLAIWTALAAFIAITFKNNIKVTPWVVVLLFLATASLIIMIQILFQIRMKLANDVDKRIAEQYEDELNTLNGIVFKKKVKDALKKVKKEDTCWLKLISNGNWSTYVHVGITIVLALCAVLALTVNVGNNARIPKNHLKVSGRYQLDVNTKGLFVLDTETSELWLRIPDSNSSISYGTNAKPFIKTVAAPKPKRPSTKAK